MKLWIDDKRLPPDCTWIWIKNAYDAIRWLRLYEVKEISLDHDLSHCADCEGCEGFLKHACECHLKGRFILWWMHVEGRWPTTKPKVHCQGPENKKYMDCLIDKYWISNK